MRRRGNPLEELGWFIGDLVGANRLWIPKIRGLDLRPQLEPRINMEQQRKFFAAHPAVIDIEYLEDSLTSRETNNIWKGPWLKVTFRLPAAVLVRDDPAECIQVYRRLEPINHTVLLPLQICNQDIIFENPFFYLQEKLFAGENAFVGTSTYFSPHGYGKGSWQGTYWNFGAQAIAPITLCCRDFAMKLQNEARKIDKDPYSLFLSLYQTTLQGNTPDVLLPTGIYKRDKRFGYTKKEQAEAQKYQRTMITEDLKTLEENHSEGARGAERVTA